MKTAVKSTPRNHKGPRCYLHDLDTASRAVHLAFSQMVREFRRNGLDYTFVSVKNGNGADLNLRSKDLYVSADILEYDRGNPFVRMAYPWLSVLLGIGAFKIVMEARVRKGENEEKTFLVKASRTRGANGGRHPTDCLDACMGDVKDKFSRGVMRYLSGD